MFLRLLAIETRKTLKHPALWLGLGALLILLALFLFVSHLQMANEFRAASGGLEKDLLSGLAFYRWIGLLVYAVTGAVVAAFDYPDRSIQLWLTRGVTRPMLLGARLALVLILALTMDALVIASLLGLGWLSRTVFFGTIDTTHLNWAALLPVGLHIFWGGVPYLALTVLLAVASRSPLFAASGTIVYGSVLEMFAARLAEKFPLLRYLPASLSEALQRTDIRLDRTAMTLPVTGSSLSEGQAALWIGLLFLLISLASFVIFSRQDLGG